MQITLLTPGKIRKRYLREACDDYLARLNHYARVHVVEVKDASCARSEGARAVRDKEAARLLEKLPSGALLTAFDEHGRHRSSQSLADWFRSQRDRGIKHLAFAIGGPLGLGEEVLEHAQQRLSLSPMTFPHELVRLMVLEQFYRAFTIIQGEPYHNGRGGPT